MEADGDDEPGYEFSTLKCKWSPTDSATATVHLKMEFCDEAAAGRSRTALQATAIVDDVPGGDCAAFTGLVVCDEAADQSLSSGRAETLCDESTAVRTWIRDARMALVGSGDDSTTAAVYEYHLRREDDRLLTLAWKIKVRPFGLATLGTIQMTEVTGAVSLTSTSFIASLIRMLSVKQKRQEQSDLAAADRERCQLEDNRRLLDELRLMADSRQSDDQRLMTRFLKVVNAKKQRIADLQQELSKLKLEREVPMTVVTATEQEKVMVRRRQGSSTGRGRPGSVKKMRRSTTRGGDVKKLCFSLSKDKNATLTRVNDDTLCSELEEMDGSNCVNISGDVVVNPEETTTFSSIPASPVTTVCPVLPVSTTDVNALVDPRYLADTQIDSPNSSPTWLQQPMSVSPSPRLQPSLIQHTEHRLPTKKSVLDDLWSGIL